MGDIICQLCDLALCASIKTTEVKSQHLASNSVLLNSGCLVEISGELSKHTDARDTLFPQKSNLLFLGGGSGISIFTNFSDESTVLLSTLKFLILWIPFKNSNSLKLLFLHLWNWDNIYLACLSHTILKIKWSVDFKTCENYDMMTNLRYTCDGRVSFLII